MLTDFRRRIAKRFPRLRKFLMPVWMWHGHLLWQLRNIFTGFRSVEITFGNEAIFMLPEGHIAEVIWRYGFEKDERVFVEGQLKPGMCV